MGEGERVKGNGEASAGWGRGKGLMAMGRL